MVILYNRSGQALRATHADKNGKPLHICSRKCVRCGGAGGSDAWGPAGSNTGWKCYRCGGSGIDPVNETHKLYTPEQNARLDAAAEKRTAKKAAARAEAARIEQERRDAQRAEIISGNEGFIARIDAELAHGEVEVLQSIRDRIVVEAKEPTDRQIEVVNQIIERNEKERARVAAARHVGTIKERRDFELTLIHTQSRLISEFPHIMSHWTLCTDENGCKIATKSSPRLLGFLRQGEEGSRHYVRGSKTRCKATVVEHTYDKNGEPLTYINRPKAA
jgi:hypothetical protein